MSDDLSVIGQPFPKVDGLGKASGQAVYADDLHLPQMLCGRLLGSHRALIHISEPTRLG